MKKYDVIVIGSGAGNIIIEGATAQGLSCAHIEKGKFGGTCLTRGCIPTKVLTTTADILVKMKEWEKIGVHADNLSYDWSKISERTWHQINISDFLENFYENEENVDVYKGTASFVEDKVIKIEYPGEKEAEIITGDKIFIAAGGRTNVPKIEGLEEAGYVTSETFFGEKFPQKPYESLTIIGGGAIGTEFAHVFASLGSKVSMVQRNPRLLPKEEPEISETIRKSYLKRDIDLYLSVETLKAYPENGKKVLEVKNKETGEVSKIISEEIFVCPGIISNSDYLHLENTGIQTDEKGWVKTNEFLETSVPGVWALGDINGKQQFRHKANYEADILVHNLFPEASPDNLRWARYNLVPAVTFATPQVSHVGLTKEAAIKKGHEIMVSKHYYSQTAKGYALGYENDGNEKGYAILIIDKNTKEFLGFHAIGFESSVLIQPFLNLMNSGEDVIQPIEESISSELSQKARKDQIKRYLNPHKLEAIRETMVPHPSLSEIGIWTFYYLKNQEDHLKD